MKIFFSLSHSNVMSVRDATFASMATQIFSAKVIELALRVA